MNNKDSDIDDKKSISHARLLSYEPEGDVSTLSVKIETGRKHQIRRHLSEVSYPIVGDRLYGSNKSDVDLKLQAIFLKFICPISGGEKIFSL